MLEKHERPAILSLAKELSKNEQKKILGGDYCWEQGWICVPSLMTCTLSPINVAYCEAVWHTSDLQTCEVEVGCG
jgi:hypothetical protein